MSQNILDAVAGYKHGLRDDMESLYYVVLYSGIRWLPHNHVAGLGEKINGFFFDYLVDGVETVGGGEKSKNVRNGRFTESFKWEDNATLLWMAQAWGLQNIQFKAGVKKRIWTPVNFMSVWTDALKLNPPKTNRFEHMIRIGNRDFTAEAQPATNTVSLNASHINIIIASLIMERGLKRSFGEIMTVEEPRNERAPVAVVSHGGSNTKANNKRLRQAIPILDPHNNPSITKTGSQR